MTMPTAPTAFFVGFLAALLLCTPPVAAEQAAPAPNKVTLVKAAPLNISYSLYTGGLRVVDVAVQLQLESSTYSIFASAATRGVWASLVPWRNTIKSYGARTAGGIQPIGARYDDVWREKARTVNFAFAKTGDIEITTVPVNRYKDRPTATPVQRRGAVDPVSALVQIMAQGADKGCTGKVLAFDGLRLFRMAFVNKGEETLKKNRYSAFAGNAIRCEVTFEPIAGFSDKAKSAGFWSAQDNKDKSNPLIVWLAAPAAGLPDIPVRVQSDVELGTVIAHFRRIE